MYSARDGGVTKETLTCPGTLNRWYSAVTSRGLKRNPWCVQLRNAQVQHAVLGALQTDPEFSYLAEAAGAVRCLPGTCSSQSPLLTPDPGPNLSHDLTLQPRGSPGGLSAVLRPSCRRAEADGGRQMLWRLNRLATRMTVSAEALHRDPNSIFRARWKHVGVRLHFSGARCFGSKLEFHL